MIASLPHYSKEETARRGQEIYDTVRPSVEATHQGEFVAIDIETGDYELNKDDYTATENLLIRQPNAQIWLARVGYAAAYRIGGPRSTAKRSAA
jgi:hypothetical protein